MNADEIAAVTGEILSENMFAYCTNNSVNMKDVDGLRPIPIDGDPSEYYEWKKNARDKRNEENKLGDRDTKRNDKRQINNKLGKRGTPGREEESKELHKGKKKSGKKNNKNFGNNDLKNKNYYECNLPPMVKLVTGIIIIGGTVGEDVLTGGVGVADDSFTIAAGGGLIIKAFGH